MQVFLHASPRRTEKLFENPGQRDQRGTRVEAVPGLPPAIHLSAERRASLAHGDIPAANTQAQSRGEPAQAAADNDSLHAGR